MTFSRFVTFKQVFQSCSVLLSLSVFVTTSPEYLSQPCYIKSKPCIKHGRRCRLFVSNPSCQPVRPLRRSYISDSVYPQSHPWFIVAVPWDISEHLQTTKISDDICHAASTTSSLFSSNFLLFNCLLSTMLRSVTHQDVDFFVVTCSGNQISTI